MDIQHPVLYTYGMRTIEWDEEKNKFLKKQKNICFEYLIAAIQENNTLEILKHPIYQKLTG